MIKKKKDDADGDNQGNITIPPLTAVNQPSNPLSYSFQPTRCNQPLNLFSLTPCSFQSPRPNTRRRCT